jgi:DNA-directed RNA polymerase subunit H (RpoH/RPB5)
MSTNIILNLFKSRTNIVEQLESLGYDVEDYENFSPTDIDNMFRTSQLDMLFTNKKNGRKIYVRYALVNSVNKSIANTIHQIFNLERILTPDDTLAIIQDEEPNDSLVETLTKTYNRSGIFVVVHSIKRLQYNLLKHCKVPQYNVLTEEEKATVKRDYLVQSDSQFPEISRFDPVALAIYLRPGEVVKISAPSPTACQTVRYRVCV